MPAKSNPPTSTGGRMTMSGASLKTVTMLVFACRVIRHPKWRAHRIADSAPRRSPHRTAWRVPPRTQGTVPQSLPIGRGAMRGGKSRPPIRRKGTRARASPPRTRLAAADLESRTVSRSTQPTAEGSPRARTVRVHRVDGGDPRFSVRTPPFAWSSGRETSP